MQQYDTKILQFKYFIISCFFSNHIFLFVLNNTPSRRLWLCIEVEGWFL